MALTSMHRVLFRTGLLVECVKKKSASTVPSLKRKKKTGEEANRRERLCATTAAVECLTTTWAILQT